MVREFGKAQCVPTVEKQKLFDAVRAAEILALRGLRVSR